MTTTKKKKMDPYLEFVVPNEEKTTDGVNEEREDEEGDSDGTKGENEEREGEGEFKFALKPDHQTSYFSMGIWCWWWGRR